MKDFCLSVLFLCFIQLLNAQTYSVSLVLYGCPLAELASVEKNASPKFLNERYPHTVLYSFRLGKNGVFRKDDMKDLRRETSWDASVPVSERKKFDAVKAEFGSKIEAKLSDIKYLIVDLKFCFKSLNGYIETGEGADAKIYPHCEGANWDGPVFLGDKNFAVLNAYFLSYLDGKPFANFFVLCADKIGD